MDGIIRCPQCKREVGLSTVCYHCGYNFSINEKIDKILNKLGNNKKEEVK